MLKLVIALALIVTFVGAVVGLAISLLSTEVTKW